MTKETLKQLIEIEFDRCGTISKFKTEVFRLIDLYDQDNTTKLPNIQKFYDYPNRISTGDGNFNMYENCSCNPKNGGSGICGCTFSSRPTTC